MGVLNKTMLGTDEIYDSVLLETDDASVINKDGSLYSNGNETPRKKLTGGDFGGNGLIFGGAWKIPNMLYCPENIFANKIPAFDVNFIHPNKYIGVYGSTEKSYAAKLAPTIATWYKAFRNISVVGLLCVLVYLGIRILIETSAQGKAKYQESLKNWFVALCLVFAIHFIMAGTLMIIDKVTELLKTSLGDSTIYVDVSTGVDSKVSFKTNLTGYVRFLAQSRAWGDATAYTLIYAVLVIYTIMFTFTYFKRFLWMAFLTMIAPLVSLTYPIDKAGDGKAQAFNMWFKEYIMNAILQPVHLLLYSVMVSSAIDLATDNPIYALVTIGFLIPAEKFIKKMFGLDKGETAGGLGSFAGGAMTMKALEGLGKKAPPPLGKGGPGKVEDSDSSKDKIFTNKRSTLESFKGDGVNEATNSEENKNNNYDMDSNKLDALENGLNEDKPLTFRENMKNNFENMKNNFNDKKNSLSEKFNKTDLGYALNNTAGGARAKAMGRTFIRGAKTIPKATKMVAKASPRLALKGAGMAIGTGIGVAAGIASGDASKVAQYGLAGLAAGNKIGENTYNLGAKVGKKTAERGSVIKNAYNEEMYGLAKAQQMRIDKQNEKAKKAFMKDEEEKRKYKEMAAKLEEKNGRAYDVEELMNSAFDYKVAGLDDKQIETGLELESKYGGIGGKNHDQMMDIVGLTGKYSQDYILDDKKRSAMEGFVASKVSNPKQQQQVMQLFAEAHGQGNYYKNIKKSEKNQQNQKTKRRKYSKK